MKSRHFNLYFTVGRYGFLAEDISSDPNNNHAISKCKKDL